MLYATKVTTLQLQSCPDYQLREPSPPHTTITICMPEYLEFTAYMQFNSPSQLASIWSCFFVGVYFANACIILSIAINQYA